MDKRIRIGIPFSYKTDWIAGAYYVANLIESLKFLSDEKKPQIYIYINSIEGINILRDIEYPLITFKKRNDFYKSFFIRILNKISRTLLNNCLFGRQPTTRDIDILFPANDEYYFQKVPLSKKIYWIPDFQEHFLPDFFSKNDIALRKQKQDFLVDNNAKILFSSISTQSDFLTIYPNAHNETFVLPFAVSHKDEFKKINLKSILEKYNIPEEFFFCANQFWVHKNHITVLKSLALLKQKGKNITIVFSGKQRDYRKPNYFETLMQYVKENDLESNTRFLGFIDRNEQLALMNNSLAVIQPSLFEGWSTVVEDSKSLNKTLILSNIPVHREQINKNVRFFDPLNVSQLVDILDEFKPDRDFFDYSRNRIKCAETFYSVLLNASM